MRTSYAKEAHVKDDIKALLTKHDWFFFMPPANAYGKSGISDIIAIKRGTFLAVEAKFGTNKPTAMQVGFLNSIRACDGFAMVVSDRNIDWLAAFL
jgi:Holliday junction resolvase